MGQISYGTITITDTGDVENIYIEYIKTSSSTSAPSQSDSGWSTSTPTWENGKYIWSRTATKYTGIVTPVYSSPVCITGGKGETGGKGDTGIAVSSITPLQYLHTSESSSPGKPTSTVTSTSTAAGQWTKAQPTWVSGKYMWTCTEVKYSNNTYAWTDPICANSMNKANSDAANAVSTANSAASTASAAAANASSALTAAQNAQTALNNYKGTNDTAVQALQSRASHFWWDSAGAHVASGTGTMSSSNVTENDPSTHGFNALMAPGVLSLREKAVNLVQLATNALTFYIAPNGGSQGPKALEVGTSGMKIFNPVSSNNIALMELSSGAISFKDLSGNVQATFGNNGAIQSGNYSRGSAGTKFAAGGTKIDLINGEILTRYFRLSQGVESSVPAGAYIYGTVEAIDGKIGSNTNNYWYIGNYTDYNQNQSAAIKSYGSAFIQLGNSSTWRLATNRIHGAWNDDGGGTSGLLHYPDYNNKYWDSGLHLPTSLTDKFLYIRNAPNTEDLENLQNDLDDLGYDYWTYRFYVAGDGSVYARNIYVLDDNGNITPIGGADGVYLLKSGGTMTGSITMSNGGKFIGNLQGTADNASKVNNHTVNSDVPSGAIFTDKNVQTTQANTTKLYITGTATNGTNTGTLSYDSNVYLNTTAGDLHATTFNGYALAAASAKGVDTSLTSSSTSTNLPTSAAVVNLIKQYLPLTGGNVTGAVSFGSSVSADELTVGDLVVNGAASFTNNLQANTINGVEVGASPKFTDTVTTVTTSGNGNAVTAITASNGKLTVTKGTTFLTSYTETDPVFVASAAHGITSSDISNWNSKTSNTGTVTSVRVQASSPLTSTTSTASSTTLDTTIKFANQNKNLVLAGPSSGSAAAPTFRSLVADDIPGLAWNKITSGKPTTLSGYGITDAAGLNALVGLSASSNSAGVTTFTATRASGTNPLSFEVSIVASAAAGANALRDSEGPISKGSVTKPVYFNNGVPAEANTYAGGTAVTLNNASKASSTASFYAPTSGGTTSQLLVGNGTTSAPTWKAISDIVPTKASTADTFSSAAEVKLTGDTTGSASSKKGWSITTKTDRISTVGDNHAVATTPNDYANKMIFQGLKSKATIGSPSDDTYSYLVGLRGWSDSSGGNSHELAFNNTGIFWRQGATTSWGDWYRIYTTGNKPTASDVGLGNVTNYDSSVAIKSITRSGTTFTYTTVAGGTGTFTQQDNNTWDALSTSQAGYVAKAPNDTSKFLRGDATWAAVTKANVGLGNVENTALSTWTGTNKITTVGTITTGTWNGSAIPITHGGTGQTTAEKAIDALLNGLPTWTANPTDSTYFIRQDTGGSATYGKAQFSTLWNYISGKISSSGKYVTVDTNQTLTAAATKTYLGLQTYGTSGLALGVTSGTSVTQKAVMKYDANLDAIVFQF